MPVNGRPSISQLRLSSVGSPVPSSTACVTPRPKLSQPAKARRESSASSVPDLPTDRVIVPRIAGMSPSRARNSAMPGAPSRRHVARSSVPEQACSGLRLDLADLRPLDAGPSTSAGCVGNQLQPRPVRVAEIDDPRLAPHPEPLDRPQLHRHPAALEMRHGLLQGPRLHAKHRSLPPGGTGSRATGAGVKPGPSGVELRDPNR